MTVYLQTANFTQRLRVCRTHLMIMNRPVCVAVVDSHSLIFGVGIASLDPADSGWRLIERKMLTQRLKFRKNSFIILLMLNPQLKVDKFHNPIILLSTRVVNFVFTSCFELLLNYLFKIVQAWWSRLNSSCQAWLNTTN